METEEVIKLVDGIYKVSCFVSIKGVGGIIISGIYGELGEWRDVEWLFCGHRNLFFMVYLFNIYAFQDNAFYGLTRALFDNIK